jgi:predicted Zn-dependent protease
LDTRALARTLAQISEQPDDVVDAYFERQELTEVPPPEEAAGLRVWREEGLAVRLVRSRGTWLASRDGISTQRFVEALRQAARALPIPAYPEPPVEVGSWDESPQAAEMLDFVSRIEPSVRKHHVAFPFRLRLRRHRRFLQVVGAGLAAEAQQEEFFSWWADLGWGRCGGLLTALGAEAAEQMARTLVDHFEARQAPPPEPIRGVVVLGPAAAAVLLHEAVAHALEADLLALAGGTERVVGSRMGSDCLNVLDDPGSAPEAVRRTSDDEGMPTCRRWLLRQGRVEQPLADSYWASSSEVLLTGAARRADRHHVPTPRSAHLELVPGETSLEDLLADAEGGLIAAEAVRGHLNPLSGRFRLALPFARRLRGGGVGEPVGPCTLQGQVSDLLNRVSAVGDEAVSAGAGWCAKGEQKLSVWATTPALRLEGVEVAP